MIEPSRDALIAVLTDGGIEPTEQAVTVLYNGLGGIAHRHQRRLAEANATWAARDDQMLATVAKSAREILTVVGGDQSESTAAQLLAFDPNLAGDIEAVKRLRQAAIDARKMINIALTHRGNRKESTMLYIDLYDLYSHLRKSQNKEAAIGSNDGGPCYRFYRRAAQTIDPDFPVAAAPRWRGALMSARTSKERKVPENALFDPEIAFFDDDGSPCKPNQ